MLCARALAYNLSQRIFHGQVAYQVRVSWSRMKWFETNLLAKGSFLYLPRLSELYECGLVVCCGELAVHRLIIQSLTGYMRQGCHACACLLSASPPPGSHTSTVSSYPAQPSGALSTALGLLHRRAIIVELT